MPFDGYPVFHSLPVAVSVKKQRRLSKLPRPYRATTRGLPARSVSNKPKHRNTKARPSLHQQPSRAFGALQRIQWRRSQLSEDNGLGLPSPNQNPLIAFRRFQRAGFTPPHTTCRAYFIPTTLMSFRLQGVVPYRDPNPVSRTRSSHAVTSSEEPADFEGLSPLQVGTPLETVSNP